MNIVTKKALSRREALRGMGAMVALPFLDSMVPAMTPLARTAAAPATPRLGFVYAPNGMFLPNFHPAGEGGSGYAMTPILRPLEAYREQMVVVTGLSNRGIVSPNEGGGSCAPWATRSATKRSGATDSGSSSAWRCAPSGVDRTT